VWPKLSTARWIELMEVDKKNEGGAIKFILVKPLGSPNVGNAPPELLLATLQATVGEAQR
jgi:shikimate kinase/3-dehydroquinate synthase